MTLTYTTLDIPPDGGSRLRLAYIDQQVPTTTVQKAIILLIHGFPQTSHQYRHALPGLAAAGYRCIVPDYRGAGNSSEGPHLDFRKTTMAADLLRLLDEMKITDPIHVLGHDIGGMIAFALASRWPERVRSVCWGECPLPGTEAYMRDRTEHAVQQFHFIFHSVPDLPEALVAGKERLYVDHFLKNITYNLLAFSEEDVDHYAADYAKPGAMRCAFGVYRAFEEDSEENLEWLREHGKCQVPTMILSGERSRHREEAKGMVLEVTEEDKVDVGTVMGAAHYLAEENSEDFVRVVLDFFDSH